MRLSHILMRTTSSGIIQVQKDDFSDEDPNKLLDAGVTVLLMDNIDKYGNQQQCYKIFKEQI